MQKSTQVKQKVVLIHKRNKINIKPTTGYKKYSTMQRNVFDDCGNFTNWQAALQQLISFVVDFLFVPGKTRCLFIQMPFSKVQVHETETQNKFSSIDSLENE